MPNDFIKYVIVVAGGAGSRMKTDIPKQFMLLAGRPLLMHTLAQMSVCVPEGRIILVLPNAYREYWQSLCQDFGFTITHQIVSGGTSRFGSVLAGLQILKNCTFAENILVAVHDGARPLVSTNLIQKCYESAAVHGSGVAAVPLKDSVRQISDTQSKTSMAMERSNLRIVQTPQTFRLDILRASFEQIESDLFTDDATVVEKAGFPIFLVEGEYSNIKITTPEDILLAEMFLKYQ